METSVEEDNDLSAALSNDPYFLIFQSFP
jgi:hypothetical protein